MGTEQEGESPPPHAHHHQKQPPGTDHPAMDAAALPAMYTGVESLTSAEEAANAGNLVRTVVLDGNPARTMVPDGFFHLDHDDFKHLPFNTKKALMGINPLVAVKECLFCRNACLG